MTRNAHGESVTLVFSPPVLSAWLSEAERDGSVALLEVLGERKTDECLRVNLVIAFQSIPLRVRRLMGQADFHIGCSSAEVELRVYKGEVRDYSKPQSLSVNYRHKTVLTTERGVVIEPKLSTKKQPGGEASLALGALSWKDNRAREIEAVFSSEERVIQPAWTRDAVKWRIDPPEGSSVVRDFMFGNVFLFGECEWPNEKAHGRITIRPSDISFFGRDRKQLRRRDCGILSLYQIWRRYRHIFRDRGIVRTEFHQRALAVHDKA